MKIPIESAQRVSTTYLNITAIGEYACPTICENGTFLEKWLHIRYDTIRERIKQLGTLAEVEKWIFELSYAIEICYRARRGDHFEPKMRFVGLLEQKLQRLKNGTFERFLRARR